MSNWSSPSRNHFASPLRRVIGGVVGWCHERHLDFEAGIRYRTPAGRLYAYTTWVMIIFSQVAIGLYVLDGCSRYVQSKRELVRGEKYLVSGDFATAATCFDEAIRLYPYSVPSLYFEGRSMLDRFFAGQAVSEDSASIKTETSNEKLVEDGLAFLDAAIMLEQKRTLPFIIPKMRDGISDAYYWRGRGRIHKGLYLEAIDDFSNTIRIEPERGEAYFYRAEAYFALRQLEQANNDYHQALKIAPKLQQDIARQVKRPINSSELDQKIAESTRIISLCQYDPQKRGLLAESYLSRGDAFFLKRNYKAALEDYGRLLELSPNQRLEIEQKVVLVFKLCGQENL